MEIGSLAVGGLGMSQLLRLQEATARAADGANPQAGGPARRTTPPDTAVIFIWLPGGPPHMETFDMKPGAPSEYRGPYEPIKTNVAGIEISELLPKLARVADKYALIRSVAHAFSDHGGGHKRFLTGFDPLLPVGFVNDNPCVGSVVAKCREHYDLGLPNYIAGVDSGRMGVDTFSFGSAYLGHATTPFILGGDPSSPKFQVQNVGLAPSMAAKLEDRASLLGGFDRLRREVDRSGAMDAMDQFNQKALGMLLSPKAREAFDLSREPDALRDRYGRHAWGQRALMARRLVEAGCSFVTMVMENPYPGKQIPEDCTYNWDSHAVNCHIFKDTEWRAPVFDQAITALVDDLHARGLNKKVLLIVTGEFGRTPKLSYDKGRPGRDHWPQAMSMLVSGGGAPMGQVIGSTNDKGEHPHDRPLTPNDLWATMYQHLGIDPIATFPDYSTRPTMILPFGEPIKELSPRA